MPSAETLERFVGLVESGQFIAAIENFYADDSTVQDNQAPTRRRGCAAQLAHERAFLAKARRVTARCVRPLLHAGDTVAIRWRFHYEWRDGSMTDLEEIAHQQWHGERIVSETFFYDTAQEVPKSLSTSF